MAQVCVVVVDSVSFFLLRLLVIRVCTLIINKYGQVEGAGGVADVKVQLPVPRQEL